MQSQGSEQLCGTTTHMGSQNVGSAPRLRLSSTEQLPKRDTANKSRVGAIACSYTNTA